MDGLILDFDGVIVDSEPVHEAALRRAARGLGTDFSPAEYASSLIGYDDRDFYAELCRLRGRRPDPGEFARFFADKRERVRAAFAAGEARAYSGTLALVHAAHAARVPMAVCSGALRSEIEMILDALDIRARFRAVVSADDVARAKPDPEGYRRAADAIGLRPGRGVAIEDTPTGCLAALNAGLRVVAVRHSLPRAEFPPGVALVVGSSDELTCDRLRDLCR